MKIKIKNNLVYYKILAIIAALLFGASSPFSKLLLNDFKPLQLAGLLYLGCGLGLLLIKVLQTKVLGLEIQEAKLKKQDIFWLIGAVSCGGIIAPVVLLFGLAYTPASIASLLLNFEAVATTLIALIFFKEQIGKQIWLSIILITIAGTILSLDLSGNWGFSLGALGIITACLFWGFDNNFTRFISLKDPYIIVIIKGLISGAFSLSLSFLLGYRLPDLVKVIYALLIGFVSYGFSLLLFILALRNLGASRTGAFFGIAPFLGAFISLLIFKDFDNFRLYIGLPFMLVGAYLLLKEKHSHYHIHSEVIHEHVHSHDDEHHQHEHRDGEIVTNGKHTHVHKHEKLGHEHEHLPDMHHRHKH